MNWSPYTKKEQTIFYFKRFLKVFIPVMVVVLATPELGLNTEGFIVSVGIPVLTTFEKWMREQGWYKV